MFITDKIWTTFPLAGFYLRIYLVILKSREFAQPYRGIVKAHRCYK
jgi:hypothetical protein